MLGVGLIDVEVNILYMETYLYSIHINTALKLSLMLEYRKSYDAGRISLRNNVGLVFL